MNSKQAVRLPEQMDGKLAYLVGVLIGDGYVSKPIKRKSHGSGFHWKIVITGPHSCIVNLRRLFLEVFDLQGGIQQDTRKQDAWQLRFANLTLHRFFTRVIGLPQGKKTVQRGVVQS